MPLLWAGKHYGGETMFINKFLHIFYYLVAVMLRTSIKDQDQEVQSFLQTRRKKDIIPALPKYRSPASSTDPPFLNSRGLHGQSFITEERKQNPFWGCGGKWCSL